MNRVCRISARGVALCGAALLATQQVLAQSVPSEGAAAAIKETGDAGIAEIIVTAQRFSESVQKTPLVIEVLDAKQLAGVTDVRQLQAISPGIQLGMAGSFTQTFIRGAGALNANASQESAVAYNADGVFLFTSMMINP